MLSERLLALLQSAVIDTDDIADPGEIWTRLHGVHGRRVTLVDRYDLEEHATGSPLPPAVRCRLSREVLAAQYPGLQLIGSSGGDPVVVVPSDPGWPKQFEWWATRIAAAVAPLTVRVEHIGSTSVPGMRAKPIIDIQVGVPSIADEEAYRPGIESLGLPLRAREPGHRYFRNASGRPREVQVHVCDAGGDWERDHLLFRDYLRATGSARSAYIAIKEELSERFRNDRLAYNEGKTGFILDTLEAAEAWANGTGWAP